MFDEHDEEVMGQPSFELLLRDGEPQVSGCYFMHPVLHVAAVSWDNDKSRVLVTADDGSHWFADNVPRSGVTNVVLQPRDR